MSTGTCPTGPGARATARVPGRRPQDGAVTAEAAVVLPVLVAVAVLLAWLVSVAAAQVRVVDAARETARAAARGDAEAAAVALGRRVAPAGARVTVGGGPDLVRVTVAATVPGPGRVLGLLPQLELTAHSTAAREDR